MRYAVVIEKSKSNYSAYVPDLPGCIATGSTIEETEASIREAIAFHLEKECGKIVNPFRNRPALSNMCLSDHASPSDAAIRKRIPFNLKVFETKPEEEAAFTVRLLR